MDNKPLATDLNDLRYTIIRTRQGLQGLHNLVLGPSIRDKTPENQPVQEPSTTKELIRQMLTEAEACENLVNMFFRELQPEAPTGLAQSARIG